MIIALEGIDGAGKSTLARALYMRLVEQGRPVALAREPMHPADHGGPPSPSLDRLHAVAHDRDASPDARAIAHELLRGAHLQRIIAWADDPRRLVLLDRWWLSTVVYQAATAPDLERAVQAHDACLPRPLLWVHVDTPVIRAHARTEARAEGWDVYALSSLARDYHRAVAELRRLGHAVLGLSGGGDVEGAAGVLVGEVSAVMGW